MEPVEGRLFSLKDVMCNKMWKSVVIASILIIFLEGVNLQTILPICCKDGVRWAKESQTCDQYPTPVSGIAKHEQDICLSTIQLCCEKQQRDDICEKAVSDLKSGKKCTAENQTCDGYGQKCCESCQLGQLLGELKAPCSAPEVKLDEDLKKILYGCCLEVNPEAKDAEEDYEGAEDEYGVPTPKVDNLCDLMPGELCAHICVPTPGSYYCKCEKGYVLMVDQKTCQKERTRPKVPAPPQVLVPNPEKPVPLHKPKQQKSCSEYNPCQQECVDTNYGIRCACKPGYEIDIDRKSCNDIDECLDNIHHCDPSSEDCINEVGAYRCAPRPESDTDKPITTTEVNEPAPAPAPAPTPESEKKPKAIICPPGFQFDSSRAQTCLDIDECDYENNPEVCDSTQDCINVPGSYQCRCKIGYQENPTTHLCVDINECQTRQHNCLATQRCDNTAGSYQCVRFTGCGTGYTLNAQNGLCEDDDECALGTDTCKYMGSNFQCRNTLGSFRCEKKKCLPNEKNCTVKDCPTGYHEDAKGNCVDTNECQIGTHNCNPGTEICINRVNGFECRKKYQCPKGYEATNTGCEDINECVNGQHTCTGIAQCRNHNGGYSCTCPPGYQIDHHNACQDIDECSLYVCPFNAECQNSPGSYRCLCKDGFKNVDQDRCEDVNECETSPGICQHDCINVFGSYRCTCKSGFKLHENNRACEDLNECEMYKDQRLCIGECENTPGSFTCRCPPGYVLGNDGRTCQDIDECSKNPCHGPDEVCLNTRGSYRCNSIRCPPDFIKDAEHKNRCKRKLLCMEGDMNCLNKPMTYSFNFITFVSMLPIPPGGELDLFTMRGPLWQGVKSYFTLEVISVRASPGALPASRDFFRLRNTGWNQVVIALLRPIPGPQELELQLTMTLHHNGNFGGIAVAKLYIHVSQYEF